MDRHGQGQAEVRTSTQLACERTKDRNSFVSTVISQITLVVEDLYCQDNGHYKQQSYKRLQSLKNTRAYHHIRATTEETYILPSRGQPLVVLALSFVVKGAALSRLTNTLTLHNHDQALYLYHDSCCLASITARLYSKDSSSSNPNYYLGNTTTASIHVIGSLSLVLTSARTVYFPGGTCLGILTSL